MKKMFLALTLLTFVAVVPVVLVEADSIPADLEEAIGRAAPFAVPNSMILENEDSGGDRIELFSGWRGGDDEDKDNDRDKDKAISASEPSTVFLVLAVAAICSLFILRKPRLG